jgi:hypothetical protein
MKNVRAMVLPITALLLLTGCADFDAAGLLLALGGIPPQHQRACPIGAIVRVTPFQVLIQPSRLNGHPWDAIVGAVSRVCGVVENPGALIRSALNVDIGQYGDQALDTAINRSLSAFTSHVAAACGVADEVTRVLNFLAGPGMPDVYLTYGVAGRRMHSSRVFQDAIASRSAASRAGIEAHDVAVR